MQLLLDRGSTRYPGYAPPYLRVVLIIFDLVSFFLKKYHVTATRFKPKKSILHKNKNEIVSPKSITKIQRLRAGYKHVLFLPDYRYIMVPNQSSNHARNLRELCIWTTIVNCIWTCICCSHVIIFVFYCLVRAGRVIVECTGSDSQSQSICTASICRSHVIIFVFYCLVPCHEFPDQVPGYQVPVIR